MDGRLAVVPLRVVSEKCRGNLTQLNEVCSVESTMCWGIEERIKIQGSRSGPPFIVRKRDGAAPELEEQGRVAVGSADDACKVETLFPAAA